jgi:predicted house-cleaning NTP pyrophosphatase (Maf/HAM1 superfamily)
MIVLASQSASRKAMLEAAGVAYEAQPPMWMKARSSAS